MAAEEVWKWDVFREDSTNCWGWADEDPFPAEIVELRYWLCVARRWEVEDRDSGSGEGVIWVAGVRDGVLDYMVDCTYFEVR